MRRNDAVAAPPPNHGNVSDLRFAPCAVTTQDPPECIIRKNPREVIYSTVALRLTNHGDYFICLQALALDELLEFGRVGRSLDLELEYVNRHEQTPDGNHVHSDNLPVWNATRQGWFAHGVMCKGDDGGKSRIISF